MKTYDYEVGFGRPPKAHQFSKGQSGNPAGRKPKPPAGLARTIDKLLMEPIPVTDKGESRKACALELIVMQLLNKFSDGKANAYRALCRYQIYARARPRPKSVYRADPAVYERYLAGEDVDLNPKRRRKSAHSKKKLTVDERIARMRMGLEAIDMPDEANAEQVAEIYQMLLREPRTRSPIRSPRRRRELSAEEILDLALYSKLRGKFGDRAPPTRIEGVIRRLIMKAVVGDISSAVLILDLHAYAEKQGDL